MGAWQPRQQAAKPSAGVSDKIIFRSEFGCFCPPQCSLRNGGGAEMTDLTDNADALPGRSRAGYCCCLRRQAKPRAVLLVLAGRSLAAILLLSPRPSAISENRKRSDGSSRARSGATRFPLATCGTRPVSSGLVSFRPSERNDSAPPSLAVAAVKWSGRKAAESGQAAGGSVPSQIERRAELAQSLSEKMARLADAVGIIGCRWNRPVPLRALTSVLAWLLPLGPFH